MLREGVKCKKNYKNRSGGPSEPQKGNIHGGGGLHIIEKSIYFAKKLTPGAKTPRVGSIRVKNVDQHSPLPVEMVRWPVMPSVDE